MPKELRSALLQGGIVTGLMALALVIGCLLIPGHTEIPEDATTAPAPAPTIAPNPYTMDDFQYENGFLSCSAGKTVTGIDVSHHQQVIDWQQVKAAGIEFAFIRLGYRGYSDGLLNEDRYAADNLRGAKEAGLKIGAYFFSQAVSVEEAQEEARYALQLLGDTALDLPLVYDWEYINETARTAFVSARTLTDCTIAFCETVKNAGQTPMIYFNQSQARDKLYLQELAGYQWWLAMYDIAMDFPYQIHIWQYTSTGTVSGIDGNVDVNLMFFYDETH